MKLIYKSIGFFLFCLIVFSQSLYSQISTIIPDSAFGYQQQAVVDSFIVSGAYPINAGYLEIDTLLDANQWGIMPSNLVGEDINNLLDSIVSWFNGNQQVMLYFPAGAYHIEEPLSIPSKVILKGAGGDGSETKQTHFHFSFFPPTNGVCISFKPNAIYSGIEDIYLIDDTNPALYLGDEGYKDMVQIGRTVSNCWLRGVESYKTRRFHVNIYGNHITVSGSYFHHSWDYGVGGRGYGVCISGSKAHTDGAMYNRAENNIFHDLRHSMVYQYNPRVNVMAYNFSTDPNPSSHADFLYHTRKDTSIAVGPKWNLCEGNIVNFIRFDENGSEHMENGPYNIIFRSFANDGFRVDMVSGASDQYKQNVVGSNADPDGNGTKRKIKKYGFQKYWLNDEWENIPSGDCSYYLTEEPAFFSYHSPELFDWPFLPDFDEITPAYFRYARNNGYYQDKPFTTEPVLAGWDIYDICGPPNIFRHIEDPINNSTAELVAMHNIEAGPYELASGNHIVFKCEDRITLKTGFEVDANNNNYFSAVTGHICDSKSSFPKENISKSSNNKNVMSSNNTQHFEKTSKNSDLHFAPDTLSTFKHIIKSNSIGPNPNNGIFTLYLTSYSCPHEIQIIDINGNMVFKRNNLSGTNIEINIQDKPKGIYILKLISNDDIKYHRIIYSL